MEFERAGFMALGTTCCSVPHLWVLEYCVVCCMFGGADVRAACFGCRVLICPFCFHLYHRLGCSVLIAAASIPPVR